MSRNLEPELVTSTQDVVARLDGVELFEGSPVRVSLDLRPGSICFVVGPQGAGKSTLIDLMSFHGRPAGGLMTVVGVDPARLPPARRPAARRRVGVMFQDLRLLADLTAHDNVALAARIGGRGMAKSDADITELLAWVGLAGRGTEPPGRLTEGERRRLCLARALINRPSLVLADEPLAGLPEKSAARMLRLLSEVSRAGTAVIVATRDKEFADRTGAIVVDLSAKNP